MRVNPTALWDRCSPKEAVMADVKENLEEVLGSYEDALNDAETSREHGKAARLVLSSIEAVTTNAASLSDVIPADLALPVIDEGTTAWLSSIAKGGTQTDELRAARAQIEGVLTIAVDVLHLDEEAPDLIERAEAAVKRHATIFAAQDATERTGTRATRYLPNRIRVTNSNGWVANANNGNWNSLRDVAKNHALDDDDSLSKSALDEVREQLKSWKDGDDPIAAEVTSEDGVTYTFQYPAS